MAGWRLQLLKKHAGPPQRGAALLIFLVLLVLGGLTYVVSGFGPEMIEARRQKKTDAALAHARDALVGYAITFRESQNQIADNAGNPRPDPVYGYLPLPDLGTANNTNTGCLWEGCDANLSGNALNKTIVGRFPWRLLGTEPLRDGQGECLWYVVSGSHQRVDKAVPMNWDMPGQIEIVTTTTTDTAKLKSLLTSPHQRPVAIILSPGPIVGDQNRSLLGGNDVSQCGGNYNPANYLDPNLATALLDHADNPAATSAYFTGNTSTDTSTTNMAISTRGRVVREGATMLKQACAPNANNCLTVANDIGLPIDSEFLFGAIRKNANFRTQMNTMLDRMTVCLRDEIVAAGGSLGVYGKIAGADNNTCYGQYVEPRGYYPSYKEMIFIAAPGSANVTVDGALQPSCAGALLLAGQRDMTTLRCPAFTTPSELQKRITASDKSDNCNYLEGTNLISFTNNGTSFSGAGQLGPVKANRTNPADISRCVTGGIWNISADCHTAEQDIVRCIPSGASQQTVSAPGLSAIFPGVTTLASYAPSTQTLTLGATDAQLSSTNVNAGKLFGCSWAAEPHNRGNGFRSYFRFKIQDVGDGFTFAIIDAARNPNPLNRCGAASQHLGYSGGNGITLPIEFPKIAVEFDTSRNTGFIESNNQLTNGRNDPDYTPPYDNDSHVAIMYWGYEAANTGAGVTLPGQDDNVHGFPLSPHPSLRPSPRNATPVIPHPFPAAYPPLAIAPMDRFRNTTQINRDFHVRVEVTPQARTAEDEIAKRRTWKIEAWVIPTAAKAITNLVWLQDSATTGTVTVTVPGHDFSNGDLILIREAPTNFIGDYIIRDSNTANGTFKFSKFPDPGSTVLSGQPVAMKHTLQVGRIRSTSQSMSQLSPVVKYNTCTSDANCAASQSCSGVEADGFRYCYSGHQPTVYDQQTIYDIDLGGGNYHDALQSIRLGFTIGVGSNDQVINVSEFFTTWIP